MSKENNSGENPEESNESPEQGTPNIPMENYIGTKSIKAMPMTKGEYCQYRGWKVPEKEDPEEEVYLVEYEVDENSEPNHENHKGYISMSPKHVFDKAYKPSDSPLDRVLIERDELEVKVKALKKVTSVPRPDYISKEQYSAMNRQGNIMEAYLFILNERIGFFEEESK